ncbi:transcriptional regulator [Streptacidiphilus pinicola]|uniref:Transcriptional regulator n=1 Tax=Streptacidiphilus pinicola TaxID=2219663 RepID=A0A2X0J497_9ACTN|nr:AfsR/SARP family transcriptional regulator [Streptacidiphilus pinicola]RAG85056.1 transcriptional regulator [Streptacidiphilus pinicola]
MAEHLEFNVLGPLTVTVGGASIPLGGPRQRTILALLLVVPGRVVPLDTLVDAVWNSTPPSTARTQVAICVGALRKIFKNAGIEEDVLVTAHPGYRLETAGHRFDSTDFAQLVHTGEQYANEGRFEEAAQAYTEALDIWRGPAFAGVTGPLIEDESARLEELRLNAVDDSTGIQLELGRHQELVPSLAAMVREHPLRERTRYHLMLAQYRSGRRADAMETYRDARTRFVDELGIDPGPDLQELHDAILRDDPSLAAPPTPTVERRVVQEVAVPRELPPDVAAFTGRVDELAALDTLVQDTAGEGANGTSTVGLITGAAGIGKSGLAMHWAFRAAEHFPDGQLFADLRGYDEHHEPVTAHDVLSRFLRSLGVAGEQIPEDLDERIALFRSLLADRRVLIVLDNVRSHAQIRPLMPGSQGCCVLVTSRDQLEDLVTWPARARVHLRQLSEREAVALLTAIVGEARITPAGKDALQLAELCDRLPLALRIAAARLASKQHWTVRNLVRRLSDEQRRLDELSQGESQVRVGFALSYRYLSKEAARLLRLLGLVDAPDFTAWVGAALLDIDVLDAEEVFEVLVDAQFLEVTGTDATGRLRYRMHNLVRLYARERAQQEEAETERLAACSRFLSTFLTIAREADSREAAGAERGVHSSAPGRPIDAETLDELLEVPLVWFEAERLALTSSVRQAARMGIADIAWGLTVCSTAFFGIRSYTEDWGQCSEEALAAAQAAGDLRGQGAMHYSLGTLELARIRLGEAETHFETALRIFTEAGEDEGRALTLRSHALVDRVRGDLDLALRRLGEALPLFRAAGDRNCESHTLSNIAETELDAGRPEAALAPAVEALRMEESRGTDTRNLAQALYRLGRVRSGLNEFAAAEEAFLRAVRIVKEKGDMAGLTFVLMGLGEVRLAQGDPVGAETTLMDALEMAEQIGAWSAAGRVELLLGSVNEALGRPEAARARVVAARERFVEIGAAVWQRRAEEALGALVV